MKVPFFDLGPQYSLLEGEIKSALEEVFRSQQFILGPKVEALEKAIAQYSKAKYAIGVASGSDALLLALMALEIGRGDEVILPTFTFFATAGVISRVGATPVFVDIDPQTYNMDPSKVEAKITPRTKAVIPVHLFGQCADMNPILEMSKARGLFVIEDAAQALGSEYRPSSRSESLRAGEMGDLGCFSFYPTKNLGAFGDAGMVVTNNAGLAEKVRILRVHGSQPKYYHKFVGINSRLDAVQAAVLLVKLNHLDQWTRARQGLAERYQKLFEDLTLSADGFQLPKVQYRNRHIYNQYVIRVPQRDRLKKFLAESGIGTDIYYPLPLHLQECYASLNYRRGDLPVSEKASEEVLALPIYPELTEGQQGMVAERIRAFYHRTN
ncbi:MAG: transcriptional regulator [Deltaproteobacteria bacterium RBG_13_52_11b]|nr:MAG: transcriptional regulator [Deltaproteobacteria bacterium RBG_13_52_11b]